MVYVTFESGRTAIYPRKVYESMLTPDPTDATQLRDRRIMKAMQECVEVCLAYDLTFKEIEALSTFMQNFLDEKKMFAQAKIMRPFMRNPLPEEKHPSLQVDALSIGDVDKILNEGK